MISVKDLKTMNKYDKDIFGQLVLTYYQNNPILWNIAIERNEQLCSKYLQRK